VQDGVFGILTFRSIANLSSPILNLLADKPEFRDVWNFAISLENSGEFGGHNTVFHSGRFRGLPGRPLPRSRPVSLSTVVTKAPPRGSRLSVLLVEGSS